MDPEITQARRTRGMKIAKLLAELPSMMILGETPFLIGYTDTWLPALDGYILTTHRLLLVLGKTATHTPSWSEISGFQQNPSKKGILVDLHAGTQLKIHRLPAPDHAALQAALEIFPHRGRNSDAWTSWQLRRRALDPSITPAITIPSAPNQYPGSSEHRTDSVSPLPFTPTGPNSEPSPSTLAAPPVLEAPPVQPDPGWPAAALPLGPPDTVASRTIRAYCLDTESPWLIIRAAEGATLAAFDDRLLIVKPSEFSCRLVGGHTGDWSSLFYFHDITDIDYGQAIHILTAGYQGLNSGQAAAQHHGPPDAPAINLFTMSNTVSVEPHELTLCLPYLNELQRRISDVIPSEDNDFDDSSGNGLTPAPADIAGQIERLVALQESGSLTDDHFAAALARVLDS
jgi:hypothetical protein